jgi:hypothetical protein
MKTKIHFALYLVFLTTVCNSQIYTGIPWKSGGWKYISDNNVNYAAENVIEAWQYDKGECMSLPTDFSDMNALIETFKNGDFAAGQIKAVSTYDTSCAAPGTRNFWNDGALLSGINRPAFLNKRKGETCDRFSTTCPVINPGMETLNVNDPANYANPSVVTMNDSYGRLSNAGAAMRYSIWFEAGKYNFLFKGNAAQVVKVRMLKRDENNNLTEIYSGTASASGATQMHTKVTSVGTNFEYLALEGYEKLNDHMKIYATGACVFSLQKNTTNGELLELNLNGNYVLEIISDGTNGAAGAYAFKYSGEYTNVKNQRENKTTLMIADNSLHVNLNNPGKSDVKLFNLTGVIVDQKVMSSTDNQLFTGHLPKGTYLVRIDNRDFTETHKIIIN